MRLFRLAAAAAVFAAAGAAFAWTNPFTNAGFEDGNLNGWESATTYGYVGASTGYSSWYWTLSPHSGSYHGQTVAGWAWNYSRLSQTVSLNKKDLVSGYAFYGATDYWPYYDDGQVYILSGDETGSVVHTALSENTGTVGNYGSTGWKYWEFEAASAGTYTLLGRCENAYDSALPSVVGLDGVSFEPGLIEVTFDVKPESTKNEINLKSKGVTPCAILGTADFDVYDVDVDTLAFGPGGCGEDHGKGHYEDVNGDGRTDLVLHFDTEASGIALGDTSVTVTGKTTDGIDLTGTDTISVK